MKTLLIAVLAAWVTKLETGSTILGVVAFCSVIVVIAAFQAMLRRNGF